MLHSLRSRLMLLMLAAALPAFATLLYATFWLRDQAIVRSQAQIMSQAQALQLQYQAQVDETQRLLAALAAIPEASGGQRRGCDNLLADLHRQAPAYISSLFVLGPDGNVLCSPLSGSPWLNVGERPYFRRALQASGFLGSDHLANGIGGQPLAVFTYTVRRNDAARTILVATLDFSWLRAHPQFAQLPPGAAYALYDSDGALLLRHPDKEPPAGGRETAGTPLWQTLSALPAAATFRAGDGQGGERLYAYAPLGPAALPYARLTVSVPVDSAYAEADRLLELGLLGLALAGALGLLVGWAGSRALILRPLEPIFTTVRRVAAGDLTARSGRIPGHAGEIHRLAAEVDRMAAALAAGSLERTQAEAALRRERDRAQAYLEIVGVMVVALDAQGCITLANPKACEVLDCGEAGGCLGRNWFTTFVPVEDRERLEKAFGRLIAGELGDFEYFESDVLTLNGERRRIAWHNALLHDAAERIVGILSAGADITAGKRLEEERERLQRQLYQSQKMEALGQLTGGIAHDFNNILASVLGFSKLALSRHVADPDSTLAQYLREVIAAGERARNLVAKMLTFSRTSPGGEALPLAPQPVVEEALRMLAPTIPASIRIDSECEECLPKVAIAAVDLQQILMNLVINARDAMGGKGRIRVRLAGARFANSVCTACHAEFSGDYVVLSVADSGPGIPPDLLLRIFEPFFTTKEVGKGTGMGLAIVHHMVCRAGGHIRVDSRRGEGTEFRVLLPLAAVGATLPEASRTARLPTPPRRHGRVLVVDDEPAICRLLTAALEAAGWSVQAFESPRLALAHFRRHPDDWEAVITDEAMPDLTGVELMRGVHGLRPQQPVILCTGHSDHLTEESALQLGAHRFFHKPVDTEALLAALAELAEPTPA